MISSKHCCLLAVVLLTTGQFWQDKTSRKNSRGNELYRQKQYESALFEYLAALDGDTHQAELSYNIGNTLYRQQKYSEALKAFEKVLADGNPGLQQQIYFNRGNAFFRMENYQQAIESYKRSLALAPDDLEAKHNLELALKKAQEPGRQQQKQQDQPDQKNQSSAGQDPKDASRNDQRGRESQPERQDPSRSAQKEPGNSEGERASPKTSHGQTMDTGQAHRLLDALLGQEREEQRRQALRLRKEKRSGKDW